MTFSFSLRIIQSALLVFLSTCLAMAQDGPATWKQLEKAQREDKTKTVIELAGQLKKQEFVAKNWGQAGRAMVIQITAKARLDAGAEKLLPWIDEEIAAAPEPMQPVMQAMRGLWLSQQLSRGRWWGPGNAASDEMAIADPENMDVTTWSEQRIFHETVKSLATALEKPELLQSLKVDEFEGLIKKGQLDEEGRPTLYDFIAREILDKMGSLAQERDGFIPQIKPGLSDREVFMTADLPESKWSADRALTDKLGWQAPLALWQELIRFHHKRDPQGEALLHADLDRIEWMRTAVVAKPKDIQLAYEMQLERLVKEGGDRPVATRARLLLARFHLGLDESQRPYYRDPMQGNDAWKNPLKAKSIAEEGAEAHPDSPFGQKCRDLVNFIEQPTLSLRIRNQWLGEQEVISTQSRNLEKLHYRIYPIDWDAKDWMLRQHPKALHDQRALKKLLTKEAPVSFSQVIEDEGKHQLRIGSATCPQDLPYGAHLLVVSDSENFDVDKGYIAVSSIFRSDLGLYARGRGDERKLIEGYVFSARNGDPVAGQEVNAWWREGRVIKNRKKSATSDEDGFYQLKANQNAELSALDADGGIVVVRGYLGSNSNSVDLDAQALLFTDRQAYRPGQKIRFKAILTERPKANEPRRLMKGKKVTVQLVGANGDKVADVELTSNGFGSINGEFDVPMSGLLGRYQIMVPGLQGGCGVQVEEYKRPVFEAEMETTGVPGAIGDEIELKVTATAFSGEGMDGAKVTWTVNRVPRWSPRCLLMNDFGNSRQIATGEGFTEKGGVYVLKFLAEADPIVDLEPDALYRYQVSAEITASSGESRTLNWGVDLGTASVKATIAVAPGIHFSADKLKVTVQTTTSDGKPIECEGMLYERPIEQSMEDLEFFGFQNRQPKEEVKPAPASNMLKIDNSGKITEEIETYSGEREISFVGKDPQGREVRATTRVNVFVRDEKDCGIRQAQIIEVEKSVLQPDETFKLWWASGFATARARIEIFRDSKLIYSEWTKSGQTQQMIEFPVTEALRGGFVVQVLQMNNGRLFERRLSISVPHSDKDLAIEWKHLSNKLDPGAKDVWTAVIKGADGEPAKMVEMVGTLYDASLDALFGPHSFRSPYSWRDNDLTGWWSSQSSGSDGRMRVMHQWNRGPSNFKGGRLYAHWQTSFPSARRFEAMPMAMGGAGGVAEMAMDSDPFGGDEGAVRRNAKMAAPAPSAPPMDEGGMDDLEEAAGGDEAQGSIRTNLNETAFFMPTLVTKDDGTVEMSFTIPEAATKWNFLGFAHNQEMHFGSLKGETVTSRDFMVRPNPPRFVRVGDEIEFTARLVNQGKSKATGEAVIQLRKAGDDADITDQFGISGIKQSFEIGAGESKTVIWRLKVPEMTDWLIYRASATANFEKTEEAPAKRFTDGEESWLPVLQRRILVRDAATVTLSKPGQKEVNLKELLNAKPADQGGPISVGYTVEAVPRPAWLAIKALPYLMEYPHECSEQIFNRYFANSLARHVVSKNPGIEKVFKAWQAEALQAKGEDAFTSPLARNPQLKGVMLEETPFLMEAVSEREERLRIVNLFDRDRVARELDQALEKLQENQMSNGAWPWFAGERARPNFYITAYVTAGFGRLRKIGVETVMIRPALNALPYLDGEMHDRYLRVVDNKSKDANHLDSTAVLYLYARSFFNRDMAVRPAHQASFEFWKAQAVKYWASIESIQSRAQLAVAMQRYDEKPTAKLLMEALRENSLVHEDLGRHWRQLDRGGYRWWEAPIESQTAVIEAFLEVDQDKQAVTDCQTWLLQQKRTQHWESTKATADAVYAVLVDGSVDLLDTRKGMSVKVGDREPISAEQGAKVEAGTGRINFQLQKGEIKPSDGKVVVTKENEGASWISVYWQSLQDISEISAKDTNNAEEGRGAALAISKLVFVERSTDDGKKLEPYEEGTSLKVGDTLVTRLIIENDRIYEFVHLKDQRAAGSEPMDAISGYRWNSDLFFYQETRDAASHFFIERLPAGSHVIEYRVKIQHAGNFATGIGEVECLYAPEFRARSSSLQLKVSPLK